MAGTDRAGAGRPAAEMLGRDSELAVIGEFIDRAGARGEALLLFGEPGVGKTALLQAAAGQALAAGVQVLEATGVEFEAEVSFSGLNQALLPLYDEFELLADAHRDALNVALGFGGSAAGSARRVERDADTAPQGCGGSSAVGDRR